MKFLKYIDRLPSCECKNVFLSLFNNYSSKITFINNFKVIVKNKEDKEIKNGATTKLLKTDAGFNVTKQRYIRSIDVLLINIFF